MMDKYKIKDLKERLDKETSQELKNKMLYMWIKQDHISLQEYNGLVKKSSDIHNVMEMPTLEEAEKQKNLLIEEVREKVIGSDLAPTLIKGIETGFEQCYNWIKKGFSITVSI